VAAVEKFQQRFKPERRIHAGDVTDFAAFRAGAPRTKDEATQIMPDILAGTGLIYRLEPTDVLIGNHDDRVFCLASNFNAIMAYAAGCARNEFLTACDKVKARVLDHYDINRSWIEIGNYKVMHGFTRGGMTALTQHVEHFGNCVTAHFHIAEMVMGRRWDHPVGFCVGLLADTQKLDYAKNNRNTARWSHGFVWGEYSPKSCWLNLARCEQGKAKEWRLPIV
jgi:hypothetical protein